MSGPTVFGVYGNSDSGKTMLLEALIKQLTKDGYTVASVKKTNKAIAMDCEGKDTWRHHTAGAGLVVFSSTCETDFLVYTSLSNSDIINKIKTFGSYDFIFVEGANDPMIKKIKVGTGAQRDNTVLCYKNNFKEIYRFIIKEHQQGSSIPQLKIQINGKNIPLSEFPEQIITNTLIGLLRSLKGVDDIHTATIQLTT
jgi:molybdopterin-guanine dinucleotide biosynthesis adapter protein